MEKHSRSLSPKTVKILVWKNSKLCEIRPNHNLNDVHMRNFTAACWAWVICLVSISSSCWGQNWSAPQNVSDPTSSVNEPLMSEVTPIGVDGHGNAISVWIGQDMGSMQQLVKASRFDAASGTWGAPVTIGNDVMFGPPAAPKIAVTTDGKAIAVWRSNADNAIHYNIFNSNWSTDQVIAGSTNGFFPQIGVDSSRNAVAIWQVGGTPSGSYLYGTGIMAATFSFNTNVWSSSSLIGDTSPNSFLIQPVLAVNHAGQAIALWVYGDTMMLGTAPYYRVQSNFYSNGSWAAEEDLPAANPASFATPAAVYPAVAISPTGQAIVLFYQYDAPISGTNNYIAVAAIRNGSWGTPFAISSVLSPGNTDITKITLGLSSNSAGNAIGVWELDQGTTNTIEGTTFSNFA
jgi:hypothetical protein